MERGWAAVTRVAGLGMWAVTAATFFVGIGGDHDIAEGIGVLGFVLGLFLVWEGAFTLWRARADHPPDKPK